MSLSDLGVGEMADEVDCVCPLCGRQMSFVDGEGPKSCRWWKCDVCKRTISQTEKRVLHCKCFFDACPACAETIFPSLECDERRPLLKLAICHPKVFIHRMKELESGIVDEDTAKKALENMFVWSLGIICYFLFADDFSCKVPIDPKRTEEAITVTLRVIEKASRLVPAAAINEYIPKRCPGCLMLNFIGIVAVWPSKTGIVKSILSHMAKNEITSTRELQEMASEGRLHYREARGFFDCAAPRFPGIGYCTQYDDIFSEEMVRCGNAVLEGRTSMDFHPPRDFEFKKEHDCSYTFNYA